MKKNKKLVPETLEEGVVDKFLVNNNIIPDQFDNFEKNFASNELKYENIIEEEGTWKLIKNPSSLHNIGPSARGVITSNGDFYIESFSGLHIHNDLLNILANKGILPEIPKKNWTNKLPQESGFLTMQRYKNSQFLAIGESNRILYDQMDYENKIHYYKEFLNKAKQKCPNIQFVNKLVGTKMKITNYVTNIMNEQDLS